MEVSGDEDPPDIGGIPIEPIDDGLEPSQSLVGNTRKRRASLDLDNRDGEKTNPPSESIQFVYTRPGFESDSKAKYNPQDTAPYSVHVTRIEPDVSTGLSIKLLRFAQFLHKNKITGIRKGGIKALGRNRISVEFKNHLEANNFVENPLLTDNKYSASIPRFQISRMGVVRNIPNDWSLEELVQNIDTPPNCGQVIRARRLNVKSHKPDNSVTWIPSSSVVLTFEGQVLPEKVYCFDTSLPVLLYRLPLIQCRNCCRFGHIRTQCRSKPRCYYCGAQHAGDACDKSKEQPHCILCDSDNHAATESVCPEHARQKSIKIVMAEENISHMEASVRFPSVKRSYADVTSTQQNLHQPQTSHPPNYQFSVTSSPSSSPRKSYRETVLLTPRPRPPMGKSYDISAHNNITQTPKSSQPNGCAAIGQQKYEETTPLPTPNDNLVELLVCTLINIISKFSDALPNNVQQLLQLLLSSFLKNDPKPPTMEY